LDRQLSKIARALSGARDVRVLLDLLERLERESGQSVIGPEGTALRGDLLQRCHHLESQHDAAAIKARLRQFDILLKRSKLRGFRTEDALAGLEADYRQGRRAFRRAYRLGTAEAFHDLRKHTQRHWRHTLLFAAAWPEEMRIRIDTAKALSELLGQERDYWLLAEQLGGRGQLARLCDARQKTLQASAHGLLRQLFAERPGALRRRLAAYWDASAEGLAQSGEVVAGADSQPKSKPSSRQTAS